MGARKTKSQHTPEVHLPPTLPAKVIKGHLARAAADLAKVKAADQVADAKISNEERRMLAAHHMAAHAHRRSRQLKQQVLRQARLVKALDSVKRKAVHHRRARLRAPLRHHRLQGLRKALWALARKPRKRVVMTKKQPADKKLIAAAVNKATKAMRQRITSLRKQVARTITGQRAAAAIVQEAKHSAKVIVAHAKTVRVKQTSRLGSIQSIIEHAANKIAGVPTPSIKTKKLTMRSKKRKLKVAEHEEKIAAGEEATAQQNSESVKRQAKKQASKISAFLKKAAALRKAALHQQEKVAAEKVAAEKAAAAKKQRKAKAVAAKKQRTAKAAKAKAAKAKAAKAKAAKAKAAPKPATKMQPKVA